MNTVSVVIVDDEELLAAALARLCASVDAVHVIDYATSGQDGLKLIERAHPSVALIDLGMPDLCGLDLGAYIFKSAIPTRAVALTGSPDSDLCARARCVGFTGYLLKISAPQEIGVAIRAAAAGRSYVTPFMAESFWGEPKQTIPSLRQREVLQLILQDKTNKEIASIMNIEVKTVEKHRAELKRRFHVSGTAGLVLAAVRQGLAFLPVKTSHTSETPDPA